MPRNATMYQNMIDTRKSQRTLYIREVLRRTKRKTKGDLDNCILFPTMKSIKE